MKPSLVLVGGGGHCVACADVIASTEKFTIAGILDRKEISKDLAARYPQLGSDGQVAELLGAGHQFLVTVGQIKSSRPRQHLFDQICRAGGQMPVIVSPWARVSPDARVGRGTIVMHGAMVNAGSVIGENCIVNTGAIVEHEARIGDHCHISTGAVLNGEVSVGDGAFVGSRAVVIQGRKIGGGSVVGAGVVCVRDVPENSILRYGDL
jgi:sugar O-acyltransferase (sialic acid O-acetyltransferase NeuD family)